MTANWQGNKYSARLDTPLWEMNIPGTHDSSARTNHFAYADKCQTWSITEQLDNGIRFLDLRLKVVSSGLRHFSAIVFRVIPDDNEMEHRQTRQLIRERPNLIRFAAELTEEPF